MENQVKKIYGSQKKERLWCIVVALSCWLIMMAIVSLFLGSPFPYKEKVLFFETIHSGWISTDGYLIIVCVLIGVVVGILSTVMKILRDFSSLDSIMLHNCDVN